MGNTVKDWKRCRELGTVELAIGLASFFLVYLLNTWTFHSDFRYINVALTAGDGLMILIGLIGFVFVAGSLFELTGH